MYVAIRCTFEQGHLPLPGSVRLNQCLPREKEGQPIATAVPPPQYSVDHCVPCHFTVQIARHSEIDCPSV